MTVPPISKPYEQTVGEVARALRSSSGADPSDPEKIVARTCEGHYWGQTLLDV